MTNQSSTASVAFGNKHLPYIHSLPNPCLTYLLFLPCITLRKKREPLGSSIRWDLGSSLAVSTGSPSLNHSIVGSGWPCALQFKVAGSPLGTTILDGCSIIRGGVSDPAKQENSKTWEQQNMRTVINCLTKHGRQIAILKQLALNKYCICEITVHKNVLIQ